MTAEVGTVAAALEEWERTALLAPASGDPPGLRLFAASAAALTKAYFGGRLPLTELTTDRLRDFLGRWVIENAVSCPAHKQTQISVGDVPNLIECLTSFLTWAQEHGSLPAARDCRVLIAELSDSVPRALQIASLLADHLARQRGAFAFPEFLTSFEEGGRSQFDLDDTGDAACLEGYFRILRIEGNLVEAEETINETRVFPIPFPTEIAPLLRLGFILNLELVRAEGGWQITGCGLAYPPSATP